MLSTHEIAKEQGFNVEEVARGYILVFDGEFNVEVVQKLDCLEEYGPQKFLCDTEAGKQALKDGHDIFTVAHEELDGWYIVNTPKNREQLLNSGYMTKDEFDTLQERPKTM